LAVQPQVSVCSALRPAKDKHATREMLTAISLGFRFAMLLNTCKKLLLIIIGLYKDSTIMLVAYIEQFTSEKFNMFTRQ
jgi:hypothetical protein